MTEGWITPYGRAPKLREAWRDRTRDMRYRNGGHFPQYYTRSRWGNGAGFRLALALRNNPEVNASPEILAELAKDGWLSSCADGGYTLLYYCDGTLCAKCARAAVYGRVSWPSYRASMTRDVYWEGPAETCEDCGASIESSYGDPWASEDNDEREAD